MPSHKLLALAALLAVASQSASAFTPSTRSNQRGAFSPLSVVSPLRAASSDVSIDYDSAAKLAYAEWRGLNGKGDFDAARFESFKGNYEALTIANVKAAKKARDEATGDIQRLELNEFADMTVAEYQAMQSGDDSPAPAAEDSDASPVSPLQTVMDSLAAQDAASTAIGEAAAALAEEEQKLAEKLGLASVEELEEALDAMEGFAADGGELDPTNVSREARVRSAYLDWCKEYGKDTDESRFPTFSSNYLAMEAFANENGKTMQLNKYADCSEEEYVAVSSAKTAEEETSVEVVEEVNAEAAAEAAKAEEEAKASEAAAKAKAEEEAKAVQATAAAKKAEDEAAAAAKKAEEEAAAKKKAEESATKAKAAAAATAKAKEEEAKNKAKEVEMEKQARQAAQVKALAKASAEAEAAAIAAAKEIAEKEAAQIAKRRELDAQAAEIERQKALKIDGKVAQKVEVVVEVVEEVKEPVPLKAEKKAAAPSMFGNIFGAAKKSDNGAAKAAAVKAAAAKKAEEESVVKAEAAAKKAEEDAAVKKAEEDAVAKKAEEDAAAAIVKAEAEAAAKTEADAALTKKKADAALAKKKAAAPSFGNFFSAPKKTEMPKVKVDTPAKPVVVKKVADVKVADPVNDAFASFFGSKPSTPKKEPEPTPTPAPVAKKPEPFSFFGGAAKPAAPKQVPAPAPVPAPKAAPKPFFFGASKPAVPAPVPAPAPVAKKPEPFSFFGNPAPKAAPVPSPAPAPVAKKPEPFSFFGNPAPKKAPVPAPTPAPVAKKPEPFSFFGGAAKPAPKPAPAPEPVAKQGTFSLFNFGAKADVSPVQKTAPPKKNMPVMRRGTISLGSRVDNVAEAAKSSAPNDGIPVMSNWKQEADGAVTGNISNSKVFRKGQKITTSPVKKGAKAGSVVTTSSGSKYRLS